MVCQTLPCGRDQSPVPGPPAFSILDQVFELVDVVRQFAHNSAVHLALQVAQY